MPLGRRQRDRRQHRLVTQFGEEERSLHRDGRIESTWSDDAEPADLRIVDGQLDDTDGYIHFAVPARRWWDDIALT